MTDITVSDYVTTVCREYRNNKTATMEYLSNNCGTYSATLFHIGMATHKISKNAINRSFDIIPNFMCERLLDKDGQEELNRNMKIFNEFIDKMLLHMKITDDSVIFNDDTVISDYESVITELDKLKHTVDDLKTHEYGDFGNIITQELQALFENTNEICGLKHNIFIVKELLKLGEFIQSSQGDKMITVEFKKSFPDIVNNIIEKFIPSEHTKSTMSKHLKLLEDELKDMFDGNDDKNPISGWISDKGTPHHNKTLLIVMDPRFYYNESVVDNHDINMLLLMELEKQLTNLDVVFFPCFAHDVASIKKYDLHFKLPSSINSDIVKNYSNGILLKEQSALFKSIAESKKDCIIINNMSVVSVDQSINIPMWLMNTLLECDNLISNSNKNAKSNNQLLTILITRTGFVPSGFYVILNKFDSIKALYSGNNNGSIVSITNNERQFSLCTSGSRNSINDFNSDDIQLYTVDANEMSIGIIDKINDTVKYPENKEIADDKKDRESIGVVSTVEHADTAGHANPMELEENVENIENDSLSNSMIPRNKPDTSIPSAAAGGGILDTMSELKNVKFESTLDNIVINKSSRKKKHKQMNLFNTSKYV